MRIRLPGEKREDTPKDVTSDTRPVIRKIVESVKDGTLKIGDKVTTRTANVEANAEYVGEGARGRIRIEVYDAAGNIKETIVREDMHTFFTLLPADSKFSDSTCSDPECKNAHFHAAGLISPASLMEMAVTMVAFFDEQQVLKPALAQHALSRVMNSFHDNRDHEA